MKTKAWWISRMAVHHPYVILVTIFLFSITCLALPLLLNTFPNFSDPQLGFEARGTTLAQRFTAWQNLMESTRVQGSLIDNPLEYQYYLQHANQHSQNKTLTPKEKQQKTPKKKKKNQHKASKKKDKKWEERLENESKESHGHLGGFCNSPNPDYSRVVLAADSKDGNLWSMDGVIAQCSIDEILRKNPKFTSLCETDAEDKCCRSWSPANYVALLSNRSSCLGVTESDLRRVETLLDRCAYFYRISQLTPNCDDDFQCQRQVPAECYAHNAPYHLLHYLLDRDFIPRGKGDNRTNVTLNSVMLFLPFAASTVTFDYFDNVNIESLTHGKFRVVAMQLGLKNTLFDYLLVTDTFFLLFGFIFVTLCIWVYTGSFLITVSTILAVVFSLGISFAIYTFVLRITFFPFMNVLAIIVAVGIGSDDVFIFCKVWELTKQQKLGGGLLRLMQETMSHAVPSMFVTSFTTIVAFFASSVSNVTAINCFSVFAGTTVMVNFALMVTWLPASMVVSEYCRPSFLSPANFVGRNFVRPLKTLMDKSASSFAQFLKLVTIKLRWFCMFGLSAVAIVSSVVVFHYPGLQLPNSLDLQLFVKSHIFEQYDLVYSKKFHFERYEMAGEDAVLPMRFVWGIKPVDNGDYLNPYYRGSWEPDETFDVSTPESQLWLQKFCRNLRAQPFYRSTLGPLIPNCFIETLHSWMKRPCEGFDDTEDNKWPCCANSTFPYSPTVLRQCAAEANAEIYRTPKHLWNARGSVMAGLKFLKDPLSEASTKDVNQSDIIPTIQAVIVEYDSTQLYSLSYTEMATFYNKVESWMQEQLRTAPPEMQGGWFISSLEFYELQRTLYRGTLLAIAVSMGLSLVVLMFVTLDLLVSIYAIVAISAVIIVTIAVLVLCQWKLNVLESVAISTAIGLAVDFSLHYSVNYRASKADDRLQRVKVALEQMGGPTLMAGITTGAAGAFMLPSHVLAYIQIGLFLLLIMSISWVYATFFLCPLLAIAGPSSEFFTFQFSRVRKLLSGFGKDVTVEIMETDNESERKRVIGRGAMPESTLSRSSTLGQFHCGELEALSVRSPSPSEPPTASSNLLR